MDLYHTQPSFADFLEIAKQKSSFEWAAFFVSCLMCILTLVIPLYIAKVINNNFPLLDPYEQDDIIFHNTNCISICSGSILDLKKRMCWDYVRDDLFILDLNRPIIDYDRQEKVRTVLRKYKDFCRIVDNPIIIFFNGYT